MTAVFPQDRDHLLRGSYPLQTRFLDDSDDLFNNPMSEYFDAAYRTQSSTSKFSSSPPKFRPPPASPVYTPTLSSLSSDAPSDGESDEISLPAFEEDPNASHDDRVFGYNAHSDSESTPSTPRTSATNTNTNAAVNGALDPWYSLSRTSSDDASIESEPERHVDYLSHEWREEDIWTSWRYVVSRRDRYSNGVRLENASWRTWAKSKYQLKTVSPETLNWLKDCDVTWLYGPLQTDIKSTPASSNTKPPASSTLSSSNSFLDRKSILKKKTASEAILQRSLSQHTLLKHAGAILQAQTAEPSRGRPSFERAASDIGPPLNRTPSNFYSTPSDSTSSGLLSPAERRHIHFNNEVVQCIAVEAKDYEDHAGASMFFLGEEYDDDYEGFDEDGDYADEEDAQSDEGVVMMKQVSSRASAVASSSSSLSSTASSHSSSRSTSRTSSASESKTIAPLPPTTLKCRSETPELPLWAHELQNHQQKNTLSGQPKLSPTPSVETLRPTRPEANFLLDDDDEEDGMNQRRIDSQWSFNHNRNSPPRHHSFDQSRSDYFYSSSRDRPWFVNPEDREELENGDSHGTRSLHLTPSGMFMPYEEGDASYTGVFGRIVDTVNTARDIAHVIWNVGWRK